VVGERVFAAEIDSQRANHTRHDWRHHDTAHTPHRVHDLPAKWRVACVRMVAELGLLFGAIDMILTPDGRYVFLELNPNGEYLWIEHLTGLAISDAVCELLVSREAARTRGTGVAADSGSGAA
jgi:glutathione synthase/RimK-type ligase-like ATP-grasp enzyme